MRYYQLLVEANRQELPYDPDAPDEEEIAAAETQQRYQDALKFRNPELPAWSPVL